MHFMHIPLFVTLSSFLFVVILIVRPTPSHHHETTSTNSEYSIPSDPLSVTELLEERWKPRNLQLYATHQDSHKNSELIPSKQFFQLHHMKTGGTSLSNLIQCGLKRAIALVNKATVPADNSTKIGQANILPSSSQSLSYSSLFYKLEECNPNQYKRCVEQQNPACVQHIHTSSVMEFCAPLYQVHQFQWDHVDAITVIRNPLERVWSMFRFRTKDCYNCLDLKTIYNYMDQYYGRNQTLAIQENDDLLKNVREDIKSGCLAQLVNHQTHNLLSSNIVQDDDLSVWISSSVDNSESNEKQKEQIMEEAIYNLRHQFVIVGITEELDMTANMIGHVFPWLATKVSSSSISFEYNDNDSGGQNNHATDAQQPPPPPQSNKKCPLGHANSSPRNNRCGPSNTHWDLPSTPPDEETIRLIYKYNQLDLKLYEAAQQRFQLQKEAYQQINK